MKLFKKNKTHAGQSGDADKKVKNESKESAKKTNKRAKNHSLDSWVLQPLAVAVVCFGLCYLLIELFFLKPLDTQHQTQLVNVQAQALQIEISRYFNEQIHWLDSLARTEMLDKQVITQVLKKTKAELNEVRILSAAELNDLRAEETLSFASVDLLRRVIKGEKTSVEAFLQEKEWHFQIATQMLAKTDSEKSSHEIMLAVFDLSALNSILKKSQQANNGQVAIELNGMNKPILQLGHGLAEHSVTLTTSIPDWLVSFSPAESSVQAAERTILWLVLLVVLIIFIVMLMLIFRININAIKRDLQRATQMVSKSIESETQFLNSFYFGEVFSMANAIVTHSRQVILKYKKQDNKIDTKDSEVMVAADDEPLFDDDLFDLDALDEPESENISPSELAASATNEGAIVEEKELLNIEVSEGIFRAYDIRGIVDETLSPEIVELLGKAIASEALAQGQETLCIGYDGRLSSRAYAEALIKGAISTGMNAILLGQVPTPVLYFATHHFKTGSGVMITGSHNPANYNGFKMMIAGTTLSGEAIKKLYNRIVLQDFSVGHGERSEQNIDRQYLDTILNDIAVAAPLKVVIDAGNGVAGSLAPDLIEELGCEVIPLHCEVDGTFPNHHPDPSQPENLQDLIAAVKKHNADIGLAFDGDGDRIGVVTNTGKIIWPDRLLMLFAKDVVSRNPGADIIYDVKCSRRLNALISGYGGRPVMWKSGHSLVKAKMKETGALLAGEMSGHIFFKERWFGFDDGLYSAARLLEILGVEDKTSEEVFAEFPEDLSTPEINIPVNDDTKFSIIEKLCDRKEQFVGGNVSTIDGLRVDYPNGWGLCRASNTMPVLVLRFEADNEAALAEIKAKFKMHLKDIDASLDCDF
jgi:phosphomannomutase/phosphoglucomutase